MEIHDYLAVPVNIRLAWFKGTKKENKQWTGLQKITYFLNYIGPKCQLP